MTTRTLTASAATYANSSSTRSNYGGLTTLRVGGTYSAWVNFGVPAGMVGGTVTKAVVRLYGADAVAAASRTLSVYMVKESWSEGKLTYAKRPADVAGPIVKTFAAAMAKYAVWEIDVTAHLQAVAAGASWYGIRVTSSAALRFMSDESSNYKPRLEISWADAPATPSKVAPAGGRAVSVARPVVSCDYLDMSSDALAGIRVRTFATETAALANTTPVWDSGDVPTDAPQLDLAATTFPAMAAGQVVWWRVQVKDATNVWSEWSAPASWTYQPLGVLTITDPSGGTIGDPSPPILWTYTGQQSAQVRVLDALGSQLWTSGRVATTDTSLTVPDGVITTDGAAYTFEVTAWDSVARETLQGAPASSTASVTVTLVTDAAVAGVSGLAVAQVMLPTGAGTPQARITWSRSPLPDGFVVWRDGLIVARVDYDDLRQPDGTFAWTDPGVDGRTVHTWDVQAVVNGKSSVKASASATIRASHEGMWLLDPAGLLDPIVMWGDSLDSWELGEASTWHEPYGLGRSVLVTQSLRGVQGSFTGDLVDVAGYPSAVDARRRLLALRERPGRLMRLVLGWQALDVRCSNITVRPVPSSQASFVGAVTFREERA